MGNTETLTYKSHNFSGKYKFEKSANNNYLANRKHKIRLSNMKHTVFLRRTITKGNVNANSSAIGYAVIAFNSVRETSRNRN